jgi:hypothetical protein
LEQHQWQGGGKGMEDGKWLMEDGMEQFLIFHL